MFNIEIFTICWNLQYFSLWNYSVRPERKNWKNLFTWLYLFSWLSLLKLKVSICVWSFHTSLNFIFCITPWHMEEIEDMVFHRLRLGIWALELISSITGPPPTTSVTLTLTLEESYNSLSKHALLRIKGNPVNIPQERKCKPTLHWESQDLWSFCDTQNLNCFIFKMG